MGYLDTFTDALASATGLKATRDRAQAGPGMLYVAAPTYQRATMAGNVLEVPVWLIGQGTGTRAEIDALLEHVPGLLEACGAAQATPEPFDNDPSTPAYRITATLTIPRS